MSTSTERTLQGTLITAIGGLTYITANSIPVRHWDDNTTARALPCVLVQVQPRERIAPNFNFYRLPVAVTVVRERNDDSGGTADQIYNDIATWAGALTASSLSCDGIVMTAGVEEVEDNIHFRTVNFDLHKTIP